MSLFNSVLSAASSLVLNKDQQEQATLLPVLLQAVNQYPGGVMGLMQAFQQGGLGAVVSSWVGQSSSPMAVNPSQLQQVLGSSMVNDLMSKSGLDQASVLKHVGGLLPMVVSKVFNSPEQLAPEAMNASIQAPKALDVSSVLTSVLGMLKKS